MGRLGSAGLIAASIGAAAFAPTLAAAQGNSSVVNRLVGDAHFAQFNKQCEKFDIAVRQLDLIATEGPNSIGTPRRSIEETDLARRRAAELRAEGCPKGLARFVRSPLDFLSLEIAGGASRATVPQINGGTQFDPIAATEIPIISSASRLTGGGGGFSATAPTPDNILWGDYFYVRGSGSWFDGSANGSVPIGATGVAQTYIIPNPASGSTGILAGATGQTVQIDTDGHIIDVSFGVQSGLPGIPNTGPFPLFSDPRFHVTTGFRYRNFDLSHRIAQQSLTFPGLNSQIDLDQSSNFFGAQVGFGFTTAPPGAEPGFFGSIDGFVAPGVLITSGTATQNSNCVPCGGGSPEFAVTLQRDFDTSNFSVIVGGSGSVGYRFNANVTASVFGTVEYMTGVPYFNLPTTPTQQPINMDGRDDFTSMSVGARLRLVFGYQ